MAGLRLCCLQGSQTVTWFPNAGTIEAGNPRLHSKNLSFRRQFICRGIAHLKQEQRVCNSSNESNGTMITSAESKNNDTKEDQKAKRAKEKVARRAADVRGKISDFLEQKSGYSWLLGPIVSTTMIVIPATTMCLSTIFQRNYVAGLAATFGLDILFVISTDLFLVLTNKLGHHNQVSGGPPPWIGPWEFTGYPEGFPKALNYVSYAAVGVAALATLAAFVTGKLLPAVAVLAPYLSLIFVQVAYERLMTGEKLPVSPLVPIVYTVYRFRQLSRGLLLMPILDGGGILARFLHISSSLWVLYLALYLTQLPWLYSTWNMNRAT
ncbi:hypothetical protein Mapa_006278 [Marchantia paleacea]|nr:hypothetical protein Mapa_006278 [Marchantia paleacea]